MQSGSQAGLRVFLVAAVGFSAVAGVGLIAAGRRGVQAPSDPSERAIEIRAALTADAAKPRFSGDVWGWFVAPPQALDQGGRSERELDVTCQPTAAGEEVATDLDFTPSFMPDLPLLDETRATEWLCDGRGLSVAKEWTFESDLGSASLWIEQAVWGRRAVAVDAADDRVEAGTVGGRNAILVHAVDDDDGLGPAQVIVIVDDSDPEYQILRVTADNGIPFADVLRIAEGIR